MRLRHIGKPHTASSDGRLDPTTTALQFFRLSFASKSHRCIVAHSLAFSKSHFFVPFLRQFANSTRTIQCQHFINIKVIVGMSILLCNYLGPFLAWDGRDRLKLTATPTIEGGTLHVREVFKPQLSQVLRVIIVWKVDRLRHSIINVLLNNLLHLEVILNRNICGTLYHVRIKQEVT